MLRLYTFTISHFSEKTRWALDFERIAYVEERLLPGLHVSTIRRRAPKASVPMLDHDGTIVQGSTAILDYMGTHLGGTKLAPSSTMATRSSELEARADHAFGVGVQRILYDVLLEDRRAVIGLWSQDHGSWSRAFYAVAFPFIASAIKKMYAIRPEEVVAAKDTLRRFVDETDGMLKGQRYLLGDDAPSRVDIAVAALFAPLCCPPEHVTRWPKLDAKGRAFQSELEGRPTWDFVLRMYRDHRASSPAA